MGKRIAGLGSVFLLITVGAVLVIMLSHQPRGRVTTAVSQWPTNLMIARAFTDTHTADVVMWDGTTWQTVVPSTALAPITLGGRSYTPHVFSLFPDASATKIAMWIQYCLAVPADDVDECTAGSAIYDTNGSTMTAILPDESVVPVGWVTDGQELLLYNASAGYGSLYAPGADTAVELDIPADDFELSGGQTAIDKASRRALISAYDGDGVVHLDTGNTVWLAGGPAPHMTAWMAFSPDGGRVVSSRVRANGDNRLGAGDLKVHNAATGALFVTITPPAAMDFAPSWYLSSNKLAFLRGNYSDFISNPSGYGPNTEDMGVSVESYDISSGVTTQLQPADKPRQDLIVVGSAPTIAYLAKINGRLKAAAIDENGAEVLLITDTANHTALAWPH